MHRTKPEAAAKELARRSEALPLFFLDLCSNLCVYPEFFRNAPTSKYGDLQDLASSKNVWQTILPPSHGGGQGFESPRLHFSF
jgi:hypothetical protein